MLLSSFKRDKNYGWNPAISFPSKTENLFYRTFKYRKNDVKRRRDGDCVASWRMPLVFMQRRLCRPSDIRQAVTHWQSGASERHSLPTGARWAMASDHCTAVCSYVRSVKRVEKGPIEYKNFLSGRATVHFQIKTHEDDRDARCTAIRCQLLELISAA